MEIIENKAVVVATRKPEKITQIIEQSKVLEEVMTKNGPGHKVAIKWTLRNAKILQMLGFKKVPSPIMGNYSWPGMYTPFAHQKETAAFLTLHQRAYCFNEQGTGKTMAVAWALDYLMKRNIIKRALIICPLSIMDAAWRADLFKSVMHRKVDIAHGSPEKRKAVIKSDAEIVIINFDGCKTVRKELAAAEFDVIVCDECFVAGTLVATPEGKKPIENINIGEEVITSSGPRPIKNIVSRTSNNVITLELSNGQQITCTTNHPFFTDAGWLTAENTKGRTLISDTGLSHMRRRVLSEEVILPMAESKKYSSWADLLQILRAEEIQHNESGDILFSKNAFRATWDEQGSEALRRIQGKNVSESQSEGDTAKDTWGQWDRENPTREFGAGDLESEMGMELCGHVGEEAKRLSYMLQNRLRKRGEKDWFGDRGGFSFYDSEESAGQEEGREIERVRVVNISYNEYGSARTVYNLEVEGTPNYFVGDGYLVHNCTALKNPGTDRWKDINTLITHKTWLWLLTGTPAAQSPMDAYGLAKIMDPKSVPSHIGSFRDQVMYKVTTFRWIPKPDAQQKVHKLLQPALRFTKEQCLDLPERLYMDREVPLTTQQKKYYDLLKKEALIQAAGEEISAVNAAVVINKLLQISCIAYNTPVLTDTGWVPIQEVTSNHKVWDGEEWVNQDGAIFRGEKEVEECWGVLMTDDHLVLTTDGWIEAGDITDGESGVEFTRAKVWLPDCCSKGGDYGWYFDPVCNMAVPMRLRESNNKEESIPTSKTQETPEELRLSPRERNAQNEQKSCVFQLPQHGSALFRSTRQRLSKLRSEGNNCLRTVERIIYEFLGRHGADTSTGAHIRQNRQQWPVFPGELQVGYTLGVDAPRGQKQKTYDLLNCGPRSRFVVAGAEGPLIVHNCGAAYSDTKEVVEFDCSHKLNEMLEIIHESSHKTLVFANFTHSIQKIQDFLNKHHITNDTIHGGVSATKRTEIINKFQTSPEPQVLVIQPQAAAHGITLHAANTVVWFGPVTSVEVYLQANDRVHRAGQKNACTVVHLISSEVEKRLYRALSERKLAQSNLLAMYKNLLGVA